MNASALAEAVGLTPAALTRRPRAPKAGGLVEDPHPAFGFRVRLFSPRPEPAAALKA